MKPKLYQYAACPFCWKVRVSLAFKGVDYDVVEVNPLSNKEIKFSKDYDKVPIYIDTKGNQINDSSMIMRHIDLEFPGKNIFDPDPKNQVKEEQWMEWSEKEYVQALPTILYDSFPHALKAFDYITRVGNFSWVQTRLIKYSGALVMSLVAKKIKKRLNITNPTARVRELLQQWTDALEGKNFLGGAYPNAADFSVYGISMSIEGLPASHLFSENKVFDTWFNRMRSLFQ